MTSSSESPKRRHSPVSYWPELPDVLLINILRRLHTLQDFFAVRAVCRNWRSVASPSPENLCHQSPLLLVCRRGREKTKSLFDFASGHLYSVQFPWTRLDRSAVAYSQGHLVTLDNETDSYIQLWNLFTGATTLLPKNRGGFGRVILSAHPDSAHCRIVLVSPYFDFVQYLNVSNTRWIVASSPNLDCVRAMMFFRGELLALTGDMELRSVELIGGSLSMRKLGGGGVVGIRKFEKLWLGELDGVPLAVWYYYFRYFKVFLWNSDKKGWKQIYNLRDKGLFIDARGDCVSISSTGLGLRKNCVYLAGYMEEGWAEFSLRDSSYKKVKVDYPSSSVCKPLSLSPVWVFPNNC